MSIYSKDPNNKSFCILPFVHTHLNTEGDVYPCCVGWNAQRTSKIGDLKDASLEELFNSEKMKQLRKDMVAGNRRPEFCDACYKREDAGFHSARHGNNDDYLEVEKNIVDSMREDGYLEPIIRSWDIRFSNLCNLKCRTCGDVYSTTWSAENLKFDGRATGHLKSIPENFSDPLENQYQNVDKIYFAGGEPLIMAEHFNVLDNLVSSGRSKEIKLVYNTNMTKLNYENKDLIEYWKSFKEVVLGMSIDGYGHRAEYIRNGVSWNQIEKNIKKIVDVTREHKNISYHYSVTVSIFNIYSLTDLHKYFYEAGMMADSGAFLLNILLGPTYYEIKNLSDSLKNEIKLKIEDHLSWLTEHKKTNEHGHCYKSYESLISYLEKESCPEDVSKFVIETEKIDSRRNQSFEKTFPEYREWWNDITSRSIRVKNI